MDTTLPRERGPGTGPEFVVCESGRIEFRDPERPGWWLSTDRPVEIVR